MPTPAQTCASFLDVPSAHPFCADIQWMYNRGVTTGCAANASCPTQAVTREQLAAFLHPLADSLFPPTCANGSVMKWNGAAWARAVDATGVANAFLQGGNAFGAPGVLGTNDAYPLDVRVQNLRALRLEPNAISPNVLGGHANNQASGSVRGAAIGGGGVADAADPFFPDGARNRVTDHYSYVGGGFGNLAAGQHATIPGGSGNTAPGDFAVALGRNADAAQDGCVVFSDASSAKDRTPCDAANGFVARAKGGFTLTTGGMQGSYTGAQLATGSTAWAVLSDRNAKENLAPVDPEAILIRVAALVDLSRDGTNAAAR